jgi:hypothetical protein
MPDPIPDPDPGVDTDIAAESNTPQLYAERGLFDAWIAPTVDLRPYRDMIRNAWIGVESGARGQEFRSVQYDEVNWVAWNRQINDGVDPMPFRGPAWQRFHNRPDVVAITNAYDLDEPRGEMVSAESREMLRDSDWLGKIMMELGLGSEVVDQTTDPDALLRLVYAKVKALKTLKDGPVRTETVFVPLPNPVDSASSTHGHMVQYRILDMDDGVHESTAWISVVDDASRPLHELQSHLPDYQLQGLDVRIEEYRKCNHVNLTTRKEWE